LILFYFNKNFVHHPKLFPKQLVDEYEIALLVSF